MNHFMNGVYTHGLRLAFIACFLSLATKYGILVVLIAVFGALFIGGLLGMFLKTKAIR